MKLHRSAALDRSLPPAFFDRPAEVVARDLLGKTLARRNGCNEIALTVTETEAYLGPHDLACHSARGRTPRTEIMFGPPGTLYIYLIYGIYLMLNVVTGPDRCGAAVLIRSAGKIKGPGRLGSLLDLTPAMNGKLATPATGLWLEERENKPLHIMATARVGVGYAGPKWSARKLRFFLPE